MGKHAFLLALAWVSLWFSPLSTMAQTSPTVPPGVLLDLRPDFQLEQTQAPKILAIRFNDSLTDRAKVGKPIDVHVVAFVDVAGKVPLQPDQVQVFVEDLDSGQFLYGGFKLEGGALIVQEPGYYRIKAVIEGKNVQGGAASTTKQVRVR